MKLLKVAKREYLDRVKRKSFLIGTILGPVLMAGIILVPSLLVDMAPEQPMSIAVVDLSGSLYDEFDSALADTLPAGERQFSLRLVAADAGSLDTVKRRLSAEVDEDVLDGYLVLNEEVMGEGGATFYSKRVGRFKVVEQIKRALNQAVVGKRLSTEGMDYEVVQEMLKGVKLSTMKVSKGGEERTGFDTLFFATFIFIMMLYMTILMWGIAVQRSIIEEKNNRVVEVLLSSLRPIDLMAGKIFGVGAVGLTQYAIWSVFAGLFSVYAMSSGAFAGAVTLSATTLAFFVLYYLLGFLFYATIFAGVGSICNTDQEAQQLQQPVVLCLLFTILVPMFVIQNPDGMFATVISMIPFFSPIVMFMRINILMPPIWQIVLSVVVLIAGIYVSGVITAKIFRTGVLMYGKRPALHEVFKWLRRA